jgi:NhaA family Na+:H+ antiporter
MEASGGIVLVITAIVAIIIANTSLFGVYDHILNGIKFRIGFNDLQGSFDYEIKKSILHWINDGFMAIFFFLVGLEIKREIVAGELSSRSRALLPAIAAVGGMAVPALIYWFVNLDTPENLVGWAIPAATDIAFALGVLALLGSRAPIQLKILLTAIAVIDDLGAIIIIAFFYTHHLNLEPLYFGAVAMLGLLVLNRAGISRTAPYVILGVILWVAVLKSGVHATLAGVTTALFIPVISKKHPGVTPCKDLEHALHPWVSFVILPIFAFANAGVPFVGMGLHSLVDPTTLGIVLGLVVGKQLGIFSMLWLCIKAGWSPMPAGTTWVQLYAVSALCGIGFTMSLFIGGLAFSDVEHQAAIRLGVLVGSVISATVGYTILRLTPCPDTGKEKA